MKSIAMSRSVRSSDQQVEDACLHRDVERGQDLVAEKHAWLGKQRAGDGDALALAAGKLGGVAVEVVGGQVDLGQGGGRPVAGRRRR